MIMKMTKKIWGWLSFSRGLRILCATLTIVSGVFSYSFAKGTYGPGQQIERYPQVVTDSRLVFIAKNKIAEELKEMGEARRYEVALLRAAATLHAPPGKLAIEASLPREIRYGYTTPVYLSIYLDGKFYRRATCYFKVTVYDKILVAMRDLPLEREIKENDVKVLDIAIEDKGQVYIKDATAAIGKVPARVIKAGTPIKENMLQSPIVIESGVNVTIISNKNGIKISAEGVAMQRGRIGKIIKVRNAVSRKVLRARVIDAQTVEIV